MSLLLVCCYNKPETQEQKVNIVQEFKRTNKLCISIEYKQPVNGYTVKVICSPYDCYDKERGKYGEKPYFVLRKIIVAFTFTMTVIQIVYCFMKIKRL